MLLRPFLWTGKESWEACNVTWSHVSNFTSYYTGHSLRRLLYHWWWSLRRRPIYRAPPDRRRWRIILDYRPSEMLAFVNSGEWVVLWPQMPLQLIFYGPLLPRERPIFIFKTPFRNFVLWIYVLGKILAGYWRHRLDSGQWLASRIRSPLWKQNSSWLYHVVKCLFPLLSCYWVKEDRSIWCQRESNTSGAVRITSQYSLKPLRFSARS